MAWRRKQSALGTLREFLKTHEGVEGYLEPQTSILKQSLLLVARDGDWVRAPVADRGQAAGFCKKAGVPFYDAAVVGYPERMRGSRGAPAPQAPSPDELRAWFEQNAQREE